MLSFRATRGDVIRVERGFFESIVDGQYLCITFSFRDPQAEVVSKSVQLSHTTKNVRDGVWALWRGYRQEDQKLGVEDTVRLLETTRQSYMPDEGTPRDVLGRRLSRQGIMILPSVLHDRADRQFPVALFRKDPGPDGSSQWKKWFRWGGWTGDPTIWRLTTAARWSYGGRPRSGFHEFAFRKPSRIGDRRYESLLAELAEFSDALKAQLKSAVRSADDIVPERAVPDDAGGSLALTVVLSALAGAIVSTGLAAAIRRRRAT